MTATSAAGTLPVGTTPETARLHRRIQRFCYVLLIGLVIEGSLGMPLLMVWYGWPTLSIQQICDELDQHTFNDPTRHCPNHYPLTGAPFGGPAEGANEKTAKDTGVVQPVPHISRIGFRDLVRIHDEQVAAARRKQAGLK